MDKAAMTKVAGALLLVTFGAYAYKRGYKWGYEGGYLVGSLTASKHRNES